jgi:hypothetical protein
VMEPVDITTGAWGFRVAAPGVELLPQVRPSPFTSKSVGSHSRYPLRTGPVKTKPSATRVRVATGRVRLLLSTPAEASAYGFYSFYSMGAALEPAPLLEEGLQSARGAVELLSTPAEASAYGFYSFCSCLYSPLLGPTTPQPDSVRGQPCPPGAVLWADARVKNGAEEFAHVQVSAGNLNHIGFGKPPLESRAKAVARLDLAVSAGWASPSSRGPWGGDALLLSTGAVCFRIWWAHVQPSAPPPPFRLLVMRLI